MHNLRLLKRKLSCLLQKCDRIASKKDDTKVGSSSLYQLLVNIADLNVIIKKKKKVFHCHTFSLYKREAKYV